jgi:myo-inositol 2-dehydrogenase/D-chiro-inositol 1-dehydrogenase
MKQVKIGMVGLGFIASGHASCYRNDCRVRIAAAAETDPGKRRSFASRFTVDSYVSDWKDLVKDPSIDVIDITAPNFLHAQIAREALRQGKAVIVEKPLALTLQEAEGVMEELEKRSLTTLYAENRLFAPVFRKAKELLASGSLGQPLILRVNELGSGPTHSGWFWDRSKTGGGALMDLGIHGLCMAEWLLEQPIVAVQALAAAIRWEQAKEQDIEETVTTIARFRTGAIGQFICSWGIQGDWISGRNSSVPRAPSTSTNRKPSTGFRFTSRRRQEGLLGGRPLGKTRTNPGRTRLPRQDGATPPWTNGP